MSTFIETKWPIVDLTAVCALQDLGAAGPLLLNGTLLNTDIPDQISFINAGFIRSVSITSANNLSGVTIMIQGLQNGAYITESITGPNNTTIYGTMYYDIIFSVIASGAVTGISVGTGKAGYLPLIAVNTVSNSINYSCSVLLPAGSGITYSLLQTLEQISINYIALQNQISTKFFPSMGLTTETTSQIGNSTEITNYILLNISNSTLPITDTLTFIFLQE